MGLQAFLGPHLSHIPRRRLQHGTVPRLFTSATTTPTKIESLLRPSSSLFLTQSSVSTDVLSTGDILIGSVLAFALAFLWSYLEGKRSQSDILLWTRDSNEDEINGQFLRTGDNTTISKSTKTFDGNDWKQISRPENYFYYNTKVRKQLLGQDSAPKTLNQEQTWVLVALLVLFVPVFSVEFFLALSRGVLCSASFSDWSVAQELCAPQR